MAEEWEKFKQAIKKPDTAEARKEAAQQLRKYLQNNKGESRPMLVSLGLNKPYPTAIEIKDIPDEIERNPAMYKHLKKIVGESK